MVTISDSTLRSNVYETIYDIINTGKSSYGASSVPDLYGGYPDWEDVSYPNIIVNPIEVGEDTFTVDTARSVSNKTIVVIIEIFTKKNKDLDIIADGIVSGIKASPFTGVYITGVQENIGIVFPNEDKVKQKTITITFMRR